MKRILGVLGIGFSFVCFFLYYPVYGQDEFEISFRPPAFEEPEKERGCQVAWKLASGQKEYGRLTPGERLDLDFLKQNYPETYDLCSNKKTPVPSRKKVSAYQPYTGPVSGERVVQVIDGNTLLLGNATQIELIGVKLPSEQERGPVLEYLKGLVLNKNISIEYDVQKKDKFGRSLAYVFLLDGTFVNRKIIEAGFAEPEILSPNTRYKYQLLGESPALPVGEEDEFLRMQRDQTAKQMLIVWVLVVAGSVSLTVKVFQIMKLFRPK